ASKVEVVRLSAEPVFKPAEDVPNVPGDPVPVEALKSQIPLATSNATAVKPPKRGFFRRINPFNLFANNDKSRSRSTQVESRDATTNPETWNAGSSDAPIMGQDFARYPYKSPPLLEAGDRSGAERTFGQGVQAHQAQRLSEA